MAAEESRGSGGIVAAEESRGSGGSFPLTSISVLESNFGYSRWVEEIDDWLVLNNLKPFTAKTQVKACTAIRNRLGFNARKIVKNLATADEILTKVSSNFKPKGTGVYIELVRRLHSTSLESSKDIAEYTRKFREVDTELKELDAEVALPEPYLIHLYLSGLGEAYDTFETAYIQSHALFGANKVDFDEVSLAAANEEQRIRAQHEHSGLAMFAGRKSAKDYNSGNNKPREHCPHCKKLKRKDTHPIAKCWQLHPEMKPEKFKSEDERSKKRKFEHDNSPAEGPMFGTLAANSDFNIRGASTNGVPTINIGCMAATTPEVDLSGLTIVDTGCTQHSFHRRSDFVTFEPAIGTPITGIGGVQLKPTGRGTVKIPYPGKNILLHNVLYVPELGVNLLSGSQLMDVGIRIEFAKNGCTISHPKLGNMIAKRRFGLYVLELPQGQQLALNAYSVPPDAVRQLWHARMGHMGQQNVDRLPDMATGVDFSKKFSDELTCECCVLGRHRSTPHKDFIKPGTRPMEFIHSDIIGPIKPIGFDGSEWVVTFKDDFTCYSEVYCVKHKSELGDLFRRFQHKYERAGRLIRRLRMDNGGEYIKGTFQEYLSLEGIICEPTVPGNPEQNGTAERFGQVLVGRTHPLLLGSELDKSFWPEIVKTANYLTVRSPVAKLGKTPYEAFYERKPYLGHLRTLGSKTWARNRLQKKFVDKSDPCFLLGYEGDGHIFRLWSPKRRAIIRAVDVHIQEKLPRFYGGEEPPAKRQRTSASGEAHNGNQNSVDFNLDVSPVQLPDQESLGESPPSGGESPPLPPTSGETLHSPSPGPSSPSTLGSPAPSQPVSPTTMGATEEREITRVLATHPELDIPDVRNLSPDPLHGYSAISLLAQANSAEPYEPKTYAEAMANDMHKMQWELAMNDEFNSLTTNNTWTLTSPPDGRKVLGGRWVYTLKRGPKGEITRYKARWVVRGFEQREGLDYNETFASVVKPMSYKAMFAIAAAMDWDLEQMDVKTAFLYGDVEEEIFVEQPEGFVRGEAKVCRLNKALYGLKQSPRVWYNTFASFVNAELGVVPLEADSSVFIDPKDGTLIALYVDDLLITGPSKEAIQRVKDALNRRFHMTDLGPCSYYLGMTVTRNRQQRTLRLGQEAYIEKVLRDFSLWECKETATPMETTCHLEKAPNGFQANAQDRLLYQKAVGSLMYAMLGTRPDIAYPVSVVSRYGANPTQAHWGAVKRIFRYLKSTTKYQLTFSGPIQALTGYTDSDWAGDRDTRRSTSGYIFNVGSGAISWSSKRQPIVALSTCEAEYIGQTLASKEAVWLRNLLRQLKPSSQEPQAVIIYGDNQGAIALAKNPEFHARSKHIDIRHHFVREQVANGTVDLRYTPTECQVADGLTKPLCKDKLVEFRNNLGLEYVA